MAKQKMDWGEITWLEDEQEALSRPGLHAGIVTIPAGAHQPKHKHFEEQVIYVLSGKALSTIDGTESLLTRGAFLHWNAGVEHEVKNIGTVPFKHLLISNPISMEESLFHGMEEPKEISSDLLYLAVEAIRTQFLESLHYGYAIFDKFGNLILQSQSFPEYCTECCRPGDNEGTCQCMRFLNPKKWELENSFHCIHGLEVFHYPIFFGKHFLGYIQGGYIWHSGEKTEKTEKLYDEPDNVVAGIRVLLKRIVKAIRNYCEFEQFRKELMERELKIASHEESQRILMKNLRDTQYAMTDLKINNHFLFNTLNSMASMALDGGLIPLYQSIVDLSKMFHYSLRTHNSVVTLEKEMEYVRAYLQLQKLRYENSLHVSYQIPEQVKTASVPFNFLQPIVENAFVHGFDESIHKKIRIEITVMEDILEIRIINSGKELSDQMCHTINQGILGNTSHGMSMIYQKLEAVYGKRCVLEIASLKNGNTCVTIEIPFLKSDLERSIL